MVVVSKAAEESIRSNVKAAEEAAVIAEQKAKSIIADAMEQSEKIKKDAFEKGYSEGMQKAQKANEEMLELQRQELYEFMRTIQQKYEERLARLESSVLELSCAIAEKIVNITLEKNDIVFVGLIKKAVQQLGACEKFTIRVGTREYDRYFGEGCQWLADELACAPFKIIRDCEIKDGGCVIEYEDGMLDASVSTQLKKTAKLLGIG
jgi:flagellar assembly protein FliH